MRLALATATLWLWLVSALAFGQAVQDDVVDDNKVSNDQPGRPLQMPPASTEVKEALDDFERFQRRGAWERALKALYTIPDDQTQRFVDGENGFIIPVALKRRLVLSGLSPEGQAAYRLFYDAEAKKLFDEAEGASEQKNLERVYSAYFASTVGDNAADRLGDLEFERGHFDRAADCWLAILRERSDSELSPALISVKAALALRRAGRRSEFEQVRTDLAERHADEKVTLGGQTGAPVELLGRLMGPEETAATPHVAVEKGPDLTGPVAALWQLRFAESVEAGMSLAERNQWESNPLSAVVPAVAVDGSMLFANYLDHVFALDLKTGKMRWRSTPFHHLDVTAMQDQVRMIDSTRFAIVASGEHVWTLGRDLKDQNFMAPFHLTCRRADRGDQVWQSTDLPDYAQLDLVGPPLLAGGKLYIAAKTLVNPQQQQRPADQFVLAIQPHDGKVLWKTQVGSFRQGNQMYFYYYNRDPSPQPQLIERAGAVYVDTQVGVLARLDADSGALDWGFGYRTDPAQSQSRFFFFGSSQSKEPTSSGSPPLPLPNGEALLIKGVQSDRLYAIDPNRRKVLWERPIAKSSRLLSADDRALYLGGPEINELDLKTRTLEWSTRLPNGSVQGHLLTGPEGLWQLTPRGVFEIDPKSGSVRRIFRGDDLGAVGGDLYLTTGKLLAVSNRTISVYPRGADTATTKTRASDD